jgi:hypothetical protein
MTLRQEAEEEGGTEVEAAVEAFETMETIAMLYSPKEV